MPPTAPWGRKGAQPPVAPTHPTAATGPRGSMGPMEPIPFRQLPERIPAPEPQQPQERLLRYLTLE